MIILFNVFYMREIIEAPGPPISLFFLMFRSELQRFGFLAVLMFMIILSSFVFDRLGQYFATN